jgi:hypothetical protein
MTINRRIHQCKSHKGEFYPSRQCRPTDWKTSSEIAAETDLIQLGEKT